MQPMLLHALLLTISTCCARTRQDGAHVTHSGPSLQGGDTENCTVLAILMMTNGRVAVGFIYHSAALPEHMDIPLSRTHVRACVVIDWVGECVRESAYSLISPTTRLQHTRHDKICTAYTFQTSNLT